MSHVICPGCGRPSATARALPTYRYKESGIPNLWLKGGVTQTECDNCGQSYIKIEKESQLLQVIALGLLIDARPLTGHEMRFLRGACQMSQARLAEALKKRRETISEREAKQNPHISYADEVLLRLVLLRSFKAQLEGAGEKLLTKNQRQVLTGFTDWFSGFSEQFAERMTRRTRLIAAMDDEGELWSLGKAA